MGGWAISAQDKYALKVPGGLSFSEFKGYEAWQVISVSHGGQHMAAILGNPLMIKAYVAGIPGNGKPFREWRQDGEDPLETRKSWRRSRARRFQAPSMTSTSW